MKRILASLLLLVIISSCSLGFAADLQPKASELIIDTAIYAFDYGGGSIAFATDITTYTAVDQLGFSSLKLQEKQGSDWVTVKSATNKYAYNTGLYSYSLSYNGTRATNIVLSSNTTQKMGVFLTRLTVTSSTLTAKRS